MSIQVIQGYLDDLYSLIENPSNNIIDASATAGDLKNVVLNEVSNEDRGLAAALVLSSEHSILDFLRNTIAPKYKDLAGARKALFEFLEEYVKVLGKRVQEYVIPIKSACFYVFRRDPSNSVRSATFAPTLKILGLKLQMFDAEVLEVAQMADTYLEEFVVGKLSPTVKGSVLHILGAFAEYFPAAMASRSEKLIKLFIDSLEPQFRKDSPDRKLISGGIRGLSQLLVALPENLLADTTRIQKIYTFVSRSLVPPETVKTFELPKAALQMIEKQAPLFRQYLTEQSEKIYKLIVSYCTHANRQLQKVAFPALEAFLVQIASEITSGARNVETDKQTFKFFMKEFWSGLENRVSSLLQISVCIRGFGRFAKATKKFSGIADVKKMSQKLLLFSERYASSSAAELEDTITHLPNFLTAFANIFLELDDLDSTFIDHLERMIGIFFLYYPQLYEYQRWLNYAALSRLMISLYSKGSVLQQLLSKIVFKGLMLTCSKPINLTQDPEQSENYFEYQDLWNHILNPAIPKDLEFPEESKTELCGTIYTEFMSSIVLMIQKLQLQYTTAKDTALEDAPAQEQDGKAEEPALKPVVPKDFELFLNLVEFCKLIFPKLQTHQFSKWIYIFGREVITKSNGFPLVSGLYKLLSLSFKIADKLSYFEGLDIYQQIQAVEGKETTSDQETKEICFVLFSKFIKEVLLRLKQYKDELLGACLQMVLTVPKEFVDVQLLIPPLQSAFKLGLAYLPLCQIGLDALEYWLRVKRTEVIKHLPKILPSLNDYLYISQTSTANPTATKVTEYRAEHDKNLQIALQTRALRVLAKLGGENIHVIKEVDLSETMAWDPMKKVSFELPFKNAKPSIYFDAILPRIVELALTSSERQTKVVACEVLHTLVLNIVGTTTSRGSVDETTSMDNIYNKLIPAILKLAVDVEQITRQLFEPLAMQLIHWYTKNARAENLETMAVLDAIIEAVGNPTDSALREFSAKCLSEFLQWSIKQSSSKQQEKNPFNALSLFKRLFSLAHHPDPYKRLGAITTFKQLYRVFREETALVDQFVLEITDNVLFSLRLSAVDDDSLGTSTLCAQVLDALGKIIGHYKDKLLKKNDNRRRHKSLFHFVDWLFLECARPELYARRAAFKLFLMLAVKLPGTTTPAMWVQSQVLKNSSEKRGVEYIVDKFENSVRSMPGGPLTTDDYTIEKANNWFTKLNAIIDGYNWLFSNELASPAEVFACPTSLVKHHIVTFVKSWALINQKDTMFTSLTPAELDSHHKKKVSVIMRIFKLIHLLLHKYKFFFQDKEALQSNPAFFRLLDVAILFPSMIGFASSDIDQNAKRIALTNKLCKSLATNLPADKLSMFNKQLAKFLNGDAGHFKLTNILTLELTHGQLNIDRIRALASGYQQLQTVGMLLPNLVVANTPRNVSTATAVADKLITALFDNNDHYSPMEMSVCGGILALCLSLAPDLNSLMKYLTDETIIHWSESQSQPIPTPSAASGSVSLSLVGDAPAAAAAQSKAAFVKHLTKGEIFYKNFREQIDDFIIRNFVGFAKPIVLALNKSSLVFRVLIGVIDRQIQYKALYTPKPFVDNLFAHIEHIKPWAAVHSSLEQKEAVLELLRKLVQLSASSLLENKEAALFLRDTVASFLGRTYGLPMHFKNDVLEFLPFVLRLSQRNIEPVTKAIHEMVVHDYPLASTDLPEESTTNNEYLESLNRLFGALANTANVTLLAPLFPILKEKNHRHIGRIDSELASFVKHISDDKAKDAFDACFECFMDQDQPDDLRLALTRKLCLPLLNKMSTTKLLATVQQHVKDLVEIIKPCQDQSEATEPVLIDQPTMTRRTGAFVIVEAIYRGLPAAVIKEKINSVVYPSAAARGNEINQIFIRGAYNVKSKGLAEYPATVPPASVLDYHCTAFNAVAAVVICTQSQEIHFTTFCFKDAPAKKQLLWENIVDLTTKFTFEVETNFPVASKTLSALYSKAKEKGDSGDKTSRRFLSSQYLADSSLSQDVSNSSFFGASGLHDDQEAMEVDQVGAQPAAEPAPEPVEEVKPIEAIELDPLNSNPCMLAFMNLIDEMAKKFGESWAANTQAMPAWMTEVHKRFANSSTPLNIRLFICKLIVNKPDLFEVYALRWFKPIVKLMQSAELESTFHYLLRDICIVLLKWSTSEKTPLKPTGAEDRRLASEFVHLLMSRTPHSTRKVYLSNLQIVSLLVSTWKDFLVPNKACIIDFVKHQDDRNSVTKVYRNCGLQLLGILVGNDFALYNPEIDQNLSKFAFFTNILDNLNHNSKDVFTAAANLAGLALKMPTAFAGEEGHEFAKILRDKLTFMFSKEDHTRAVVCLTRIASHSEQLVDQFAPHIFGQLRRYKGSNKVMALELIQKRIGSIPDVFKQLQPRLKDLLVHRDDAAQMVILKILKGLVTEGQVATEPLLSVTDTLVEVFGPHPNEDCRKIYYEILEWAYENVADARTRLRLPLLKGLGDQSQAISNMIFGFWDDTKRLEELPFSRLMQLMKQMYHSDLERFWLKFSVALILRLCNRTADWEHKRFKALTDANFTEMRIDSNWFYRTAPMTPLFASQSLSYDYLPASQLSSQGDAMDVEVGPGGLRATQAPQFTMTQAGAVPAAFSFGSQADTSEVNQSNYNTVVIEMKSGQTQGAGLMGAPRTPPKRIQDAAFKRPKTPVRPSLGDVSFSQQFGDDDKPTRVEITQRFTKTPQYQSQSFFFQQQALKKRKLEESMVREQRRKRFHQVTIFRQYRQGDLPDVASVTVKALVEPLTALAWRDDNLARQIMTELVHAVAEDRASDVKAEVIALLKSSLAVATPFVYWLTRTLFELDQVHLPSKLVGTTSIQSFNYHMGILLLEKQILAHTKQSQSNVVVSRKRKAAGEGAADESQDLKSAWLQLAKLYKALGEEDILRGLYAKISQHPATKAAIDAEIIANYEDAFTTYDGALSKINSEESDDLITKEEIDLWENGRLECLEELVKWQSLMDNTMKELDGNMANAFLPKFKDPYLGHLVHAGVKLEKHRGELLKFVSDAEGDNRDTLEREFSPELAFLHVAELDDLGRSRFFVNRQYSNFVQAWSNLTNISYTARHSLLQTLQKTAEIEEYLDFVEEERNFATEKPIRAMIRDWNHRYPSAKFDDISVWDDIITQRYILYNKLNSRFGQYWKHKMELTEDTAKVNLPELRNTFRMERAQLFQEIATGARKQGNTAVTDSYLKKFMTATKNFKEEQGLDTSEHDPDFFFGVVKAQIAKARRVFNIHAISKYTRALAFMEKNKAMSTLSGPSQKKKFLQLQAQLYYALYDQAASFPQAVVDSVNDEFQKNRLEAFATVTNITPSLVQRTKQCLKESSELYQQTEPQSARTAKALFKYGIFLDEVLQNEGANATNTADMDKVIRTTLQSMRFGYAKARDMFPRLLQLIGHDIKKLGPAFDLEAKQCEPWMFLRWTSQMMALLNRPEIDVLLPILTRIAQAYPQAIYYQFRISTEDFEPAVMARLSGLSNLLQHDGIEAFITALSKLTHPEHVVKDTLDIIKPMLKDIKGKRDKILSLYKEMWDGVIANVDGKNGTYLKEFAKMAIKLLGPAFGEAGEKLVAMNPAQFDTDYRRAAASFDEWMRKHVASRMKLSEFSKWLDDYDASNYSDKTLIEIPGQYHGSSKPLPEYHIKVYSFEKSLLVMGSIRKPKRLKIRGSDERELPFLVKGGEDLRLDQRVQQLFGVMNQILVQDTVAAKRKLAVHTYQVVPMTTRVGIIEWIDNTKPIKAILEEQLNKSHRSKKQEPVNIQNIEAAKHHTDWIRECIEKKGSAQDKRDMKVHAAPSYYLLFQHATREEAARKFAERTAKVPWDLLRGGIVSMANDPESFLSLRSMAATSLSVYSICQYIIGIGDRHLDNFLLNLKNGEIIGIDFGHAFGTATQFLPIPELIPFRLTPQFLNLMLPLDSDGLLKHTMVHTLQAIQHQKELILNAMDVFVHEPLIDWQKLATRLAAAQRGSENDDKQSWFPKQKIRIAKRKLDGDNPAFITLQELKGSIHNNHSYFKALETMVLGDPKANVRATIKERCESAQQQVDCLIDQATDPSILARSWFGWGAWC